MAAPIARGTKEQQCAVIQFLQLKVYQGHKSIKEFQKNTHATLLKVSQFSSLKNSR
jgi:hypothetical protein